MEEPLIDDKVRAFAEYLGCDRQLAQDIYFELGVSLSLDDENKEELRRELEALSSVASKLAAARKTLEKLPDNCNVLRFTLESEGIDLLASIPHLHQKVEEVVGFGEVMLAEETSGSRANLRADKVAEYVAAVFVATGRSVTLGTSAVQHDEPSTPFGRAVQKAFTIFSVSKVPPRPNMPLQTPHWKRPALKALHKSQKANLQK